MTLRIGLLGASRIAPKAIIAPAQMREDVVIAAVAARDLGRAQAYAETHGIGLALGGYEALIERRDIDLIYCALPPAAHVEPCVAALQAGKALLVEKPFAMNARGAQVIADAAAGAGRPALEAFHYRFHSQFHRALDIVAQGRLGRLVRAEGVFDALIGRNPGQLRWDPAQGGGGLMDLGCYVIHALRLLVGEEPTVTDAHAELEQGVDAQMSLELAFPGGVVAKASSCMTRPRCDWIQLEGEHGVLRLDGFVSPQYAGLLTLTVDGAQIKESAEGAGSYDCQLAHVVEVMQGRAQPLTGGADAVATMAVIDAARQAVGMRID